MGSTYCVLSRCTYRAWRHFLVASRVLVDIQCLVSGILRFYPVVLTMSCFAYPLTSSNQYLARLCQNSQLRLYLEGLYWT